MTKIMDEPDMNMVLLKQHHERRNSMRHGFDILDNLIVLENGKVTVLRTIEDIETLLEKLTKIQDSFRTKQTPKGTRVKADIDYLIRLITNMASFVYEKELPKS